MSAKIQARSSHRFQAMAERVYDAWLDPAKIRVWIAAALRSMGLAGDIQRVEVDPRVGGKFFFSDMRGGVETKHWGTYFELERPRKVVFTWIVDESEEGDPSVVTLTIEPEPDGCVATVVHEIDAKWAEYVARTEMGWTRMLQGVEVALG
jgi:uncharacterized protein YndB with AHSA1/START domain